jgi:hypothetical protein
MRELEFEPIFTPLDCDRHLDKDKTCTPMSDPKPTSRLRAQQPVSTPIPPSLQAKMAQFANRANNMEPQANARPILGGMAARRQRPSFSLRDIDPSILPDPSPFRQGGGPLAAGLGAGRPSLLHLEQTRKPSSSQGNFGSPFSNFSKIVYGLSLSSFHFIILKHPSKRSVWCSQFQWKSCSACCWSQLLKWCLFRNQHGPVTARRRAWQRQLRYR